MPQREGFSLNANNIARERREDSRLEASARTVLYSGRWQLFPTDIQIAILSQRPKKKERSVDFRPFFRQRRIGLALLLPLSHMGRQAEG